MPEILVFSDLDGTLLDHHSYSWQAAVPGLERLKALKAGLVLASSKTAAEMRPLQAKLDLQSWPIIVENGAGILWPEDGLEDAVEPYQRLRSAIGGLQKFRSSFQGFGDMSTAEVSDITGLPIESAGLAKQRQFSEPGLWHGSDESLDVFFAALKDLGITARQGGRFLTLSFGKTKADGMVEIMTRLKPARTIALGDAPNDIAMIEAADQGVVIANPNGSPIPELPGELDGSIIRTRLAGPAGWSDAILNLTQHDVSV